MAPKELSPRTVGPYTDPYTDPYDTLPWSAEPWYGRGGVCGGGLHRRAGEHVPREETRRPGSLRGRIRTDPYGGGDEGREESVVGPA